MKRILKKRIWCGLAALLILMSSLLPAYNVRADGENAPFVAETVLPEESIESTSEVMSEPSGEVPPENNSVVSQDKNLTYQSIEANSDSDATIVLDGIMPENVDVTAVDVTDERNASGNVLAAFDITLMDGEEEFQPEEGSPINVEISDERLAADSKNVEVWHILDDGTRVQVTDFTIEDGKIRFAATGFSVYEIVEGPEPYQTNKQNAQELSDFTGEGADEGFYLFYGASGSEKYFHASVNGSGALAEKTPMNNGSVWYMETVSESDTTYSCKLYSIVGGVKKYLHQTAAESIKVELIDNSDDATIIDISKADSAGYFILKHHTEELYLQHSGSGNGIRFYKDHENVNNSSIGATMVSSLTPPDDPYGFDGKTYGLMFYNSGTTGDALMATAKNDTELKSASLAVRKNVVDSDGILFVALNSNISMWTFHSTKEDYYTLSTTVGEATKYISLTGTGLTLVDNESEATELKVTPDGGKIRLSASGKAITFNNGYRSSNEGSGNQYLNLVKLSDLTEDDFVVYSAYKVGVSDKFDNGEYKVPNGAQIIVYTRIWDDVNKRYDFYAIDRDGSLVPCYERGDNIMWVGNRINTLLWDFTEYYNEDGTVNYYYELQNQYSGKYLAPQIKDHQVLSDNKIGINLPGRRDEQYYTEILAWDDPYYSYAGIKTDIVNDQIVSCPKKESETFYFALMEPPVQRFTEVTTVDNHQYGITMKMIDLASKDQMCNFLGTDAGGATNKTVAGILSTNLGDDGYPTTNLDSTKTGYVKGRSLGDLMAGAEEVNHLFLESTYNASGYFEFDSTQNFATLTDETDETGARNFRVYKEIGTADVKDAASMKHGQFMPYNDLTPGVYSSLNSSNLYDALLKALPEDDPRKGEKLYLVDDPNYYNAVEIDAGFVQTPNGEDSWGHDIIFEFTGDDDFWLYVDGELIIDLGGIHSALEGNVNFATGEVTLKTDKTTKTSLRDLFIANYIKRGKSEDEAQTEADKYFRPKVVDNKTYYVFNDYSEHEMKIYYMERGAGASNLHMRFNLSYITPGSVMLSKQITGTEALEDDMDFSLVEFPYQILYRMDEYDTEWHRLKNDNQNILVTYQNSTQKVDYRESYKPPKATQTFEDVYFINPGMVAEIHFPEKTYQYKIIECAVNKEVYDDVSVEGVSANDLTETPVTGNADRKSYELKEATVDERKTVAFQNHVNPEGLRTLSVKKELHDENGNVIDSTKDSTPFSFRLYLTNGADDESKLELANMVKYRIQNEAGELCRWSAADGTFVSTGKKKYSDLTDEEKIAVTFETSINGAISKIPAGHTVEIPGLPVGTIFKVEERPNEIPLGYTFDSYYRDPSTAIDTDGDTLNSGRIRANESPFMKVINRRGWEIEVTKEWTDKNYISSRDSVFTAVYVNETLLDNSVKQLKYPQTTLRYYFDDLVSGSTFDDYEIREVELNNPTFDAEGNLVSYDSIKKKLSDENFTIVNAVPKGSSEKKGFSYSVSYQKGQPHQTATGADAEGNVREDTIINTRNGGIVLYLYEMGTDQKIPLKDGVFTLQRYDKATQTYVNEGTYTSDENGRITILYEHKIDTEAQYTLTQTVAPKGYIGLENPFTFAVTAQEEIVLVDDGDKDQWDEWKDWNKPQQATDKLIAYINVYNKPYTLEVYKFDGTSTGVGGLKEAHFELHRGVKGGQSAIVKDYAPMPGYEDLVTGDNGIITGINSNLAPNNYYLTEKTPPEGYTGLKGDVIFAITPLGRLKLIESPEGSNVKLTEGTYGDTYRYLLNIPNSKEDSVVLTVEKKVAGSFGNKNDTFDFTFKTTDSDTAEYEYSIRDEDNNVTSGLTIHSGGIFTLGHGESFIVSLPKNTEVTIEEFDYSVNGYSTTVAVDTEEAQAVRLVTGAIAKDTKYSFTNTKTGQIPTGVVLPIGGMVAFALIILSGAVYTILNKRRYQKEL